MSTTVTVRIPDAMVDELDRLAASLERSRTSIVKKAVEMYLAELRTISSPSSD